MKEIQQKWFEERKVILNRKCTSCGGIIPAGTIARIKVYRVKRDGVTTIEPVRHKGEIKCRKCV
jgi:hypothetical protein